MTNPSEQERDNASVPTRQDSWEIEILMSGGAFIFLFQASDYLLTFYERVVGTDLNPIVGFLLPFMAGGLRLLSIYFAVHLGVRASWLSLVLLKKVYPLGINVGGLRLHEPYQSLASKFNLDATIRRMDLLSGLTFAWSMVFVVTFVGVGVAIAVTTFPFFYLQVLDPDVKNLAIYKVVRAIITLLMALFVIDTMAFGPFRRNKFLARIYYPVYVTFNTLSLGFLWRPGLQTIFSNAKSKGKAFLIAALVTGFVLFLTGGEEDYMQMLVSREHFKESRTINEIRYLDKRSPGEWSGSFIQSDVITDGYLRVYVYFNTSDDRELVSNKTGHKNFSQIITLQINDSSYSSPEWLGLTKQGGQRGIQTVLDISNLPKKMHLLKIRRTYDTTALEIPFWKQ